ncbi:AraC family transcriptional regulator [Brevundimonas sp. Root1279]|uniref:AraC family transcriptional regulator n=1 Tax=Brevundimonas sp. Root1279 TaxID=1736443 RepID=UPI0007014A89|nr:AraC family transcriptional regulator [Brevundimonas sp. Root1279]KQW82957.1 AraC family transcriptional regulator [Brevundimonas sp. Root1279]
MTTLIRAAVLTSYPNVACQVGLNPRALLRRVGLAEATLADPDLRVSSAAVVELLEESALESGCLTFGLRMAETRQLSDFGAMSLLLTHQSTLGDALRTTIEYRHLLNEAVAIHLEEAGDTVIVRTEVVTDSPAPARQATELALGVLFRMCNALLGSHWRPYSVNFSHAAPPDLQVHRRMFGTVAKMEFNGDFNGFVCSAADLQQKNPTADPVMARYAERFLESLPVANEMSAVRDVRRAIYLFLPMGRATIEQVAQGMGLNVRTLQRQLDEGGATFSELLNEVRRDLALRYMENENHSLGRIAELLGYSMPSSFTRWFAAQFGSPPAQWRVEHGGRAGSVRRNMPRAG